MQIRELHYGNLGQAYTTVKQFLEKQSGCNVHSLQARIGDDLGLAGDDVEELLVAFVQLYSLSWGDFDFSKHFYSEGELFGSGPTLENIVIMLVRVVMWLIEVLSLKFIRFNKKPDWYRPLDREVSDLTFKQMLTWYLEKDFTAVDKTLYRLVGLS